MTLDHTIHPRDYLSIRHFSHVFILCPSRILSLNNPLHVIYLKHESAVEL